MVRSSVVLQIGGIGLAPASLDGARLVGPAFLLMADAPYLVALALVEQQGQRLLPLTGKSQSAASGAGEDPSADAQTLALELLLRLWQRSDEGPLQRAGGDDSLLLVELPLEVMSEHLPLLKAKWLSGGTTAELLSSLKAQVIRGWRLSIAKYEPITFTSWS
jgi:hypothetical protein